MKREKYCSQSVFSWNEVGFVYRKICSWCSHCKMKLYSSYWIEIRVNTRCHRWFKWVTLRVAKKDLILYTTQMNYCITGHGIGKRMSTWKRSKKKWMKERKKKWSVAQEPPTMCNWSLVISLSTSNKQPNCIKTDANSVHIFVVGRIVPLESFNFMHKFMFNHFYWCGSVSIVFQVKFALAKSFRWNAKRLSGHTTTTTSACLTSSMKYTRQICFAAHFENHKTNACHAHLPNVHSVSPK